MTGTGNEGGTRSGGAAAAGARLVLVALLVTMQYWLLTAAMESVLAGDRRVALPVSQDRPDPVPPKLPHDN